MPTFQPIVQPRKLSEAEVTAYNSQGYVVIAGLISPEAAAQLRREVMHIMEVVGLGQSKLKQSLEYLEASGLDELVNSPELKRIAEQLMGGSGSLFLPFTAVKSGGGGGQFHFHQDNQYLAFPGINMWFALQPMRQENGCLQMVPRSHLTGTLDWEFSGDGDIHRKVQTEPQNFVLVEMQPGDCVAFTRDTVHGSGQNLTNEPRVGYAVQFHRDDARYLKDGEMRLLKDFPKWNTRPVQKITPPNYDKPEGH